MKISVNRRGPRHYAKASYPVCYGCYTEVEHGDYTYLFNLNGEIRRVSGRTPDWPHPAEWLKRTISNDWVYYSTGNYYTGTEDMFGEFYMPCPAYPTNTIFKEKPFKRQVVQSALEQVGDIVEQVQRHQGYCSKENDSELQQFLELVGNSKPGKLAGKAEMLHRILQARITVLPPDCRHVDYDVIPVMITDGCLYNCSFCEIKTGMDLSCRPRDNILAQLTALRDFFGPDLVNYNSIYLGQHDGLAAESGDILFGAEKAYELLNLEHSYMQGPRLFLFSSAEAFMQKEKKFWDSLDRLPFYTYINIGLESFDDNTLEFLKKPVTGREMSEAFHRMMEVNMEYADIEMTANVLMGPGLPDSHIPSLLEHICNPKQKYSGRGCIYVSPLKGSTNSRELLEQFREVKKKARMDTFLYLIQRL